MCLKVLRNKMFNLLWVTLMCLVGTTINSQRFVGLIPVVFHMCVVWTDVEVTTPLSSTYTGINHLSLHQMGIFVRNKTKFSQNEAIVELGNVVDFESGCSSVAALGM